MDGFSIGRSMRTQASQQSLITGKMQNIQREREGGRGLTGRSAVHPRGLFVWCGRVGFAVRALVMVAEHQSDICYAALTRCFVAYHNVAFQTLANNNNKGDNGSASPNGTIYTRIEAWLQPGRWKATCAGCLDRLCSNGLIP